MKKLAKLLWVGLFLMGSVAASAADFSLNPARDFGAIRRIDPTDYDGLAVVRETGAGLSSGTSEAFRNALEVFSKAYVRANYVATSTLSAHVTGNADVHGCTAIASASAVASAVAEALSAANASDALNLRLDGSRAMTGNLRLGGKWLSNDGGNEGLQVSDGGNVLIGTTSDDGSNKLQVNGNIYSSGMIGEGKFNCYLAAGASMTSSIYLDLTDSKEVYIIMPTAANSSLGTYHAIIDRYGTDVNVVEIANADYYSLDLDGGYLRITNTHSGYIYGVCLVRHCMDQ